MEAQGVAALPGGENIACSSTKALTGHTLGACGALEAAFCWLALEANRLPTQVNDGATDPALPALAFTTGSKAGAGDAARPRLRYALSNAFAFGGNNIALLLERTQ
jgi:3-oxoacyl-[acyl-carrier-protein] synthase-1